jgi:alpha-L-fucosidase
MRRMLHRCTTSIRLRGDGKLVYAPVIAAELEYQLDEWYNYLPRLVRFDREGVSLPVDNTNDTALEDFLRTQYYACKASIHWPAVYQAMEFGEADNDLLTHCQKFFHSFVQFMTSVKAAIHSCRVNMWTLFATYVSFPSGLGFGNLSHRGC